MLACQAHRKLRGDRARTADPAWLEEYSIPYDTMLSIQAWGSLPGAAIAAQGWAGCHQAVSNCTVHHLFCIYYNFFLYFPIKMSLFQPTSSTFFSFSSLSLWGGELSKQLHGPSCQLQLNLTH